MSKPPFVIVLWNDAWSDATASVTISNAHDTHKPLVMETRGWLLVDDERGVSIASERCLDPEQETYYRGRSFVLRAMVQSVTEWPAPAKPRKPRAKRERKPKAESGS